MQNPLFWQREVLLHATQREEREAASAAWPQGAGGAGKALKNISEWSNYEAT